MIKSVTLRNINTLIIVGTNSFNLKYWLLRDTCNKQNVGGSDYPRRPEAEVSEKRCSQQLTTAKEDKRLKRCKQRLNKFPEHIRFTLFTDENILTVAPLINAQNDRLNVS